MNTSRKNETQEQITINDIKAIKDYESLSDDEAIEIMNTVKQIALILYNHQKSNNHLKYVRHNPTEPVIYKQAA